MTGQHRLLFSVAPGDWPAAITHMQKQLATLHQAVTDLSANTASRGMVEPAPQFTPDQPSASGEHIAPPTVLPPGGRPETPVRLGHLIDTKIKSRIWADQYIDLALLLAPGKDTVTLSIDDETRSPSFVMGEKATQKLSGIHQWTSAFIIFSAIYLERQPHQATCLLQYMHCIRSMAAATPPTVWMKYDQEFRKCRAVSRHPWDVKHQDLYLDAVMAGGGVGHGPSQPFARQQRNRPFRGFTRYPPGFCNQFCREGAV